MSLIARQLYDSCPPGQVTNEWGECYNAKLKKLQDGLFFGLFFGLPVVILPIAVGITVMRYKFLEKRNAEDLEGQKAATVEELAAQAAELDEVALDDVIELEEIQPNPQRVLVEVDLNTARMLVEQHGGQIVEEKVADQVEEGEGTDIGGMASGELPEYEV